MFYCANVQESTLLDVMQIKFHDLLIIIIIIIIIITIITIIIIIIINNMGTGVGQVSLSLSLLRESGRSHPPESGVTAPLASVSNP